MNARELVEALAATRIGGTFNQYSASGLRRARLAAYLEARFDAPLLLVGEAAGYRGARVSGIPFTSERQLTGAGAAYSQTQTSEFRIEEHALLWNVVPTHPGTATSNRRPTRAEVEAAEPFLRQLVRGRRIIAVGRLAEAATGAPYVRHPAHGGARAFAEGLRDAATIRRRRTDVRR